MTERLHFDFSLSCTGEGNGNPLQCPSLEDPRDGEAQWAAVYGVAQSRTRLKWLSSSSSSSSSEAISFISFLLIDKSLKTKYEPTVIQILFFFIQLYNLPFFKVHVIIESIFYWWSITQTSTIDSFHGFTHYVSTWVPIHLKIQRKIRWSESGSTSCKLIVCFERYIKFSIE